MINDKEKFTLKDFLLLLLFAALLAIPIYFAYQILLPKEEDNNQEKISENDTEEQPIEEEEEVYDGPHYEELFKTIKGQVAYIAVPTNIKEDNLPGIVIYSHGSNTLVTSDIDDQFIKDLQTYGELYTKSNFMFAASNQHGANWGSSTSIQDTKSMLDWIKANYKTSGRVYLIGFSMGGLPTLNFATTYPEDISKIALLAPTTRASEWNVTRVNKLEGIDIQIWHGTSDVNVPYSLSTTFVSKLKSLNREIPLTTLKGKTHWDLDTEYMEEILEFFIDN
ncbi:MAG: alpha/beta fold hydrolase [Candidatus Dojkabacteria bacterium]